MSITKQEESWEQYQAARRAVCDARSALLGAQQQAVAARKQLVAYEKDVADTTTTLAAACRKLRSAAAKVQPHIDADVAGLTGGMAQEDTGGA